MKEFILSGDPYKMNWVAGKKEWGTVVCPDALEAKCESERNGDVLTEKYTFTNKSDKTVFTSVGDILIYTPFNDDYKSTDICLTNRCHTHIWCGGNISYVMALRMGGEAPHLGMVLTEGSLAGYSVERNFDEMSNDRGDFIMHLSPAILEPQESMTVKWVLFPHNGKEDFREKLGQYNPNFIDVQSDKFVYFSGETVRMNIFSKAGINNARVTINGEETDFTVTNDHIEIAKTIEEPAEYVFEINISGLRTKAAIRVLPVLEELAKRRCEFICENQQYIKEGSRLDGAYLAYDNEEEHMVYKTAYDVNAARERICMGLLMTRYLRGKDNEKLKKSLEKYTDYIQREIADTETGEVFNDYMRDNSYFRLYNYPWASLLFIELYHLYGLKEYLKTAYNILTNYYSKGGEKFYSIELPLCEILKCLKSEGMENEYALLLEHFRRHCDTILNNGMHYPPFEVNYEQSIVAPATNILIQMYLATGERKYYDGAKMQLKVLSLFNGFQPDYHMYETAIRHWDGYWFGKNKLYGDTYPHYWSSLTGIAFGDFKIALKNEEPNDETELMLEQKAQASLRSSLSLIFPDGRASCAYVYPLSVNGRKAGYYDKYANDQDWALYFMLRYRDFENSAL